MLLTLCIISVQQTYSQNETIEHKVKKGETVYAIARLYNVSPSDIVKLNSNAGDVIYVNDILIIPQNAKKTSSKVNSKVVPKENYSSSYLVKRGDTKYSLANRFNMSIKQLEKANPHIINGLQAGHALKVSNNNLYQSVEKSNSIYSNKSHSISKGETLYSISKKYQVTLDDVIKANPDVNVNSLKIGSTVNIPVLTENSTEERINITYVVKKGDTKYGISKKYDVSINQLESLNPDIKSILRHGIKIQIPLKNTIEEPSEINNKTKSGNQINTEIAFQEKTINGDSIYDIENNINTYKDLTKSIVTTKSNTVWFVFPFTIEEYKNFSNETVSEEGSSSYLNQNVEFFKGAEKALDSIEKLGITVSYNFIKTDTKLASNSSVNYLKDIQENSIVISPYSEAVGIAETLNKNNIPVISYVSNNYSMLPNNYIQAIHTDKDLKLKLINYLNAENNNIILISDKGRNYNKSLFTNNIANVKIIETSKRKGIDENQLVSYLEKTKNNYVVVDSKRKNMFLNSTNVLLKESSKYTIQLAVLEPSIIPDKTSISSKRYKVLNLIYPIENKSKRTNERLKFIEDYKSSNNTIPSEHYLMGFDLTFDSLLRNNQLASFNDTMSHTKTEQMVLNFDYVNTKVGGYINNNISIFEYKKTIDSKKDNE